MKVDQLLPSLVAGDAISGHVVGVKRALEDLGHRSEIFVGEVGAYPVPGVTTRPAGELDAAADAVFYHLSVGSSLTDRFLALPGRRVVVYHNVTPPRFFEGWDPPMADVMRGGYADLERCAPLCALGIGDSELDRSALDAAGFSPTDVLPILIDPDALDVVPDPDAAADLGGRRRRGRIWLFVGRFAPNKCQADVVRAFAAYRRAVDPDATLLLVGGRFTGSYQDAVLDLAATLEVGDGVIARGPVSQAELAACYRAADVFVCLSEHEGFCVPLVEAMHHRVPVVAFAAGAVPETAGGAAVVLRDKDPVVVAAAVSEVLGDERLRAEMVRRGSSRAQEFDIARVRDRLPQLLDKAFG